MSADDVAASTTSSAAPPEPDLHGQTVLVIGGSSGIGLATARLARANGALVILTARDPDRLHRVGRELGASIAAFDATDFDRLGGSSTPWPRRSTTCWSPAPAPPPRRWPPSSWRRPAASWRPGSCCRCRSPGTPPPRSARAGRCCSWAAPVAAARPRAGR
jgi:short chain dehydrogenase